MMRTATTAVVLAVLFLAGAPHSTAVGQTPFCMGGQNDILCESERLMRQFQDESRGDRSGGLTDERIYNPGAGSFADDLVDQDISRFRETFDARFGNPHSLHYDPTRDPCILDPGCDMVARGTAHYQWLHDQCRAGSRQACIKLRAGAFTPPPPPSAYPSVPRPLGY